MKGVINNRTEKKPIKYIYLEYFANYYEHNGQIAKEERRSAYKL